MIQVHLPDQAVLVALVTGSTTLAVACVRAAERVAVTWIRTHSPGPAPPPEIEPPDP